MLSDHCCTASAAWPCHIETPLRAGIMRHACSASWMACMQLGACRQKAAELAAAEGAERERDLALMRAGREKEQREEAAERAHKEAQRANQRQYRRAAGRHTVQIYPSGHRCWLSSAACAMHAMEACNVVRCRTSQQTPASLDIGNGGAAPGRV